MKRKTMRTWLSCVALLLACLMLMTALASCKDPAGVQTVTTEAAGTGSGNATGPNGSGSSEPEKKPEFPEACENHKGNFVCENCGKRMTPNGFFTAALNAEEDESFNLLFENLNVAAAKETVKIEKAEMTVAIKDNGLVGKGWMKVSVTDRTGGDFTGEGAATLKDGKLCLAAGGLVNGREETDEISISLEKMFDEISLPDAMTAILPKLPAFAKNQLLPALKAIAAARPDSEDVCARIADLLFVLTKTDNGYTVALSFDKLIALNEKLNTMKVSELYDAILGEGEFAKLETYLNGVFEKKVSEVLADFKAEGIDFVALLQMVNTLLPEDEEGNTPMTPVLQKFSDEKFLGSTVGQLILGTENVPTADELKALQGKITPVFSAMKELTCWEMIEDLTKKDDENKPKEDIPETDVLAEEGEGEAALYNTVKTILEQYKDAVSVSCTADAFGKILSASIELNVSVPDPSGDGTNKLVEISGKIQYLNKYTSTVDYAKYEEQVNASLKSVSDNRDKIAEIIKADIEQGYPGSAIGATNVSYDKETGILTASYWEGFSYQRDVNGEPVSVSLVRKVNLTVDLNTIRFMTASTDCKNTRAVNVEYGAEYRREEQIAAKWTKSGTELTAEELEKWHDDLVDNDTRHESGFDISLYLDTETGKYRANEGSLHEYDSEPIKTVKNGKWTYVHHKCKKCGYVSIVGSYTEGPIKP